MSPATESAYRLMHEGQLALAEVEENGLYVDVDFVHKTRKDIKARVAATESDLKKDHLWKAWKRRFGDKALLSNRTQLAEILVLEGLLPPEKVRVNAKSRKMSGDKKTLEIVDSDFTRAYTEAEQLKKLDSTYFAGILREVGDDGLVHPSFNLNLLISYRSSCEDPNVQNIPVRNPIQADLIRRAYRARGDDRVLVEIDYSGIEVRTAACYNNDPVLIKYLLDPDKGDMHRDSAAELFICDKSLIGKDPRDIGKNMYVFPNFYGSYFANTAPDIWDAMIRRGVTIDGVPARKHLRRRGITELGDVAAAKYKNETKPGTFLHHVRECERILWDERFTVYKRWKRRYYEDYVRNEGVITKTGFLIDGLLNRKEVSNYPIQGSAFHCLLRSLVLTLKAVRKRKLDALVCNEIHDSIIADVHVRHLDDYVTLVLDIMTRRVPKEWDWISIPLKAEVEVSPPGGTWREKKTYHLPV